MKLEELIHQANHFATSQSYREFGDLMLTKLNSLRQTFSEDVWRSEIVPVLRREPFYDISQQDPFSSWSTRKPRKYDGDAHLLDFLYRNDEIGEEVLNSTPAGQSIHHYWMNSPAARAVRDRKTYFQRQLTRQLLLKRRPRILVLACRHFREAEFLIDTTAFERAEIVCLDQDSESCTEVSNKYGDRLTIINNKVTAVLKLQDQQFDLGPKPNKFLSV